ncbi:ubiquitin-conjugating enzyme E2 [Rozella allomycis CSF55]|uniref:Ubiquitin-conjugating enzyme E2 n=1 Tax=Rozella allomycis (strain CSF55) TaxID=988480 RepID=A0A075ARC8_ROZAC|nr:Ubiquitin-conjugating enzyme E2-20 kDa [Rozella allomycis CSF55]RKP20593.1 ubiquitin-conjugating enzyme E2 [Rozella allomycis CSF55]|eukprot:EPZ32725.1 Ubiquitin-conjugating enzyme E2-20 kDa [Rozella allomycis CSF55]
MDTTASAQFITKKPKLGGITSGDGQSLTKRLQTELTHLMMNGIKGVTAFPESDNMRFWKGTIIGPVGTVYESLEFKISINFPNNYPYSPPTIKFDTTCYHPNVDLASGAICLDILKDKWSAAYTVQTILLSLQSLLGEPNNDSPLNNHAAQLWSNPAGTDNKLMSQEFQKEVKKRYEELKK